MTLKMTRRTAIAAGTAAVLARPVFAQDATVHEVQMLNADPENPRSRMVFLPRVVVVQPGDTVKFVATDRGHNSESIEDMMPEGAEGWEGRINDEVEVLVETPGFYGYKCTPHNSVGMVGLVIVQGDGMTDNLEAAKDVRQRGKARQIWDEIWE